MTDETLPKSSAEIANEFKLLEATSRKLFDLPPYQTKTREETYTGRLKYLERLATYSASFISSTTPVDPSQCAIHGWYDTNKRYTFSGSEVFRLICKECNGHLDIPNLTGVSSNFESVKKIYTLYPTFLYSNHNESCFWRNNSCHVSVCAFPLVTTSDAFDLLETQGKLFQKWGSDLPLINNPYDQSKNKIIERIIKSIENIDVFDFPQQKLTEIQKTAYLLPIFGWNFLEEQNRQLLKCSSCFRHIWLPNYLLIKDRIENDNNNNNEENTSYHTRAERIKELLHPIEEHRYYCPWRNADKARTSLKDSFYVPAKQPLTGCEWMMEMLFKEWFKLTTEDDKHPKRNEFRRKIEKYISTTVENNQWMTQDLSTHTFSRIPKRSHSVDDNDNNNESATENAMKKIKQELLPDATVQQTEEQTSLSPEPTNIVKPPVVVDEMDTTMENNENNLRQEDQPKTTTQQTDEQTEASQTETQVTMDAHDQPPLDIISIMSPSLATPSPLPSDIQLTDIESPVILEDSPTIQSVKTPDMVHEIIISDHTPTTPSKDDQLDKEIRSTEDEEVTNVNPTPLEQNQDSELMDISEELTTEKISDEKSPSLEEQKVNEESAISTTKELEEENGDNVVTIGEDFNKKEKEEEELEDIKEDASEKGDNVVEIQEVLNNEEEIEDTENVLVDIHGHQENKQESENITIELKEEEEEEEEEGELNDEQNIQSPKLSPEATSTKIDRDELTQLQDIQVDNDETEKVAIEEIEEENLSEIKESEKEEEGYVDVQEETQPTNADTDMKELLDNEKEDENDSTNIQDDLQEEKAMENNLINEIEEGNENTIKDKNEEEYNDMQDELQSTHSDTEINVLLDDEKEDEKDDEKDQEQEDHAMENVDIDNELINEIKDQDEDDKNKENEFVDIHENTADHSDTEMKDLLENENGEDKNEVEETTKPKDIQPTHLDNDMADLLEPEKFKDNDDEDKQSENESGSEHKDIQEEKDDIETALISEVEDEKIVQDNRKISELEDGEKEDVELEEGYADLQELQSTNSDKDIKESTEDDIIEDKNHDNEEAELTNIQDDLQDEKEDIEISLIEKEIEDEKVEDEVKEKEAKEKEDIEEREFNEIQETFQPSHSDLETKVSQDNENNNQHSENENEKDGKDNNKMDDTNSINIQEVKDGDLQIENNDTENTLAEEEQEETISEIKDNNEGEENEEGYIEIHEEIHSTHSDTEMTIILPNDEEEINGDQENKTEPTTVRQVYQQENQTEKEKDDIENSLMDEIEEASNAEDVEKEEGYDDIHEELQTTQSETDMKTLLYDEDDNELINIDET
ncbi:unnamed protein product [Cunninghamella echinulata]